MHQSYTFNSVASCCIFYFGIRVCPGLGLGARACLRDVYDSQNKHRIALREIRSKTSTSTEFNWTIESFEERNA